MDKDIERAFAEINPEISEEVIEVPTPTETELETERRNNKLVTNYDEAIAERKFKREFIQEQKKSFFNVLISKIKLFSGKNKNVKQEI